MKTPQLLTAPGYDSVVDRQWFDSGYWHSRDAITGSSVGRGTTWFFGYNNREFVLRIYRRGGFVSRFSKHSYVFTGDSQTRAALEFKLLGEMCAEGLPVPVPVAALVQRRRFFFYTAKIITEKISAAQDLAQLLAERALSSQQWQEIGATVARFHQARVYHSDLNLRNILIDSDGQVWLIDFDKCWREDQQGSWCENNLQRFKRSLEKEKRLRPALCWDGASWQDLLDGYHQQGSK